jgi:hypothetical protein
VANFDKRLQNLEARIVETKQPKFTKTQMLGLVPKLPIQLIPDFEKIEADLPQDENMFFWHL